MLNFREIQRKYFAALLFNAKNAAMKTYSDHQNIIEEDKGCVIAIGNFDGCHRGHQILIAKAHEKARELGTKLAVMSFSPHPRHFFKPDQDLFYSPMTIKKERCWRNSVRLTSSLTFPSPKISQH